MAGQTGQTCAKAEAVAAEASLAQDGKVKAPLAPRLVTPRSSVQSAMTAAVALLTVSCAQPNSPAPDSAAQAGASAKTPPGATSTSPPAAITVGPTGPQAHPLAPESVPDKPPTIPEQAAPSGAAP